MPRSRSQAPSFDLDEEGESLPTQVVADSAWILAWRRASALTHSLRPDEAASSGLRTYMDYLATSGRFSRTELARLHELIDEATAPSAGDGAPPNLSPEEFRRLARNYEQDSSLLSKASQLWLAGAAVALLFSVSVSLTALLGGFVLPRDNAPLIALVFTLVAVGLVVAIVCTWISQRLRLSAAESRRLARQIMMLTPFLQGLQAPVRDLIHASLAPRFLTRLLEDDDPLREPMWPTASDLQSAAGDQAAS